MKNIGNLFVRLFVISLLTFLYFSTIVSLFGAGAALFFTAPAPDKPFRRLRLRLRPKCVGSGGSGSGFGSGSGSASLVILQSSDLNCPVCPASGPAPVDKALLRRAYSSSRYPPTTGAVRRDCLRLRAPLTSPRRDRHRRVCRLIWRGAFANMDSFRQALLRPPCGIWVGVNMGGGSLGGGGVSQTQGLPTELGRHPVVEHAIRPSKAVW